MAELEGGIGLIRIIDEAVCLDPDLLPLLELLFILVLFAVLGEVVQELLIGVAALLSRQSGREKAGKGQGRCCS